jgi:hypothetical protein
VAHVVPIDEWALTDDRTIIVSLIESRGRWRFEMGIWFRDQNGDEYRDGRVVLGVRHLERLANAVEKARRGAVARYLIKPKELIEADES